VKLESEDNKPDKILELFDQGFRNYLKEIQGHLYMHISSSDDIERQAAEKKEEEQA
jgi:hypothetical protein